MCFLVAYLIAEVMFMIFEVNPYPRLVVLILLMILDGILTNYLMNHRWVEKWKREAPDVLDAIRAPEPAYITPPVLPSAVTASESNEPVRYHRTQHKELEAMKNNEAPSLEAVSSKPSKDNETASAIPTALEEQPHRFFARFRKQNKPEPVPVEEETPKEEMSLETEPEKEPEVSSWSVPFDEMPTEELETAVEKAMDGGYNPE